MTITEAFREIVGDDVSDKSVELALLNANLDGSAEYTASLRASVERSAIDTIFQYIAVTSESESQYSTSKDGKIMQARLLALARKYGRKDIISAISGRVVVKNISRIR